MHSRMSLKWNLLEVYACEWYSSKGQTRVKEQIFACGTPPTDRISNGTLSSSVHLSQPVSPLIQDIQPSNHTLASSILAILKLAPVFKGESTRYGDSSYMIEVVLIFQKMGT
jgi:hypothetical protein